MRGFFMSSRIVIIRNPVSGSGVRLDAVLPKMKLAVENAASACELEWWFTEYPGHATELAQRAVAEGVTLCIAAGGDGTMHEVALGLLGSGTSMGILPLGSGNGLARHLGLSMEPMRAFEMLLTGRDAWMDAGKVNGQFFFLAAGIGFEGVVAHRFAKAGSRGFAQYIFSSMAAYFSYKPIRIVFRDEELEQADLVFTSTIANGAQYGNDAWIAPEASIVDGKLNWTRISPFPLWEGPGLFYRLLNRGLKPGKRYLTDKRPSFELEFQGSIEGHLDGEPVYFKDQMRVECVKDALKIRVPRTQATI